MNTQITNLSQKPSERLVVSFTTVPWRMQNLPHTLALLQQQSRRPDAIYLGIPRRCRRNNEPYPAVPPEIFMKFPTFKVVSLEQDHGSICKIMGGALAEHDPDTLIVTIDDDFETLPPHLLRSLEQGAMRHRDVAWALRGHQLGRFPFKHAFAGVPPDWSHLPNFIKDATARDEATGHPVIQVLYGVGGVCYRRKFLPSTKEEWSDFFKYAASPRLVMHDDVWLSAYLSEKKVKVYQVPGAVDMLAQFASRDDKRGLSNQLSFKKDYVLAIADAKDITAEQVTSAFDNMEKIENPASTLTFWAGAGTAMVLAASFALVSSKISRKKSMQNGEPKK